MSQTFFFFIRSMSVSLEIFKKGIIKSLNEVVTLTLMKLFAANLN